MKKLFFAFIITLYSFPAFAWHSDWIHDERGIIDKCKTPIDKYHASFLKDFDIDLHVMVVSKYISYETFGAEQFLKLKVGSKSSINSGILAIFDVAKEKLEIRTSPTLKNIYTDEVISELDTELMADFFYDKKIDEGTCAVVEALYSKAMEQKPEKSFEIKEKLSTSEPMKSIYKYMKTLEEQDSNPYLEIYTDKTKLMLSKWTVTRSQMRNELNSLRKCGEGKTIIDKQEKYAVIRHKIKERKCAPYFLEKEEGEWKLDLATMQKAIRFNTKNQFHFIKEYSHPYKFAFKEWDLDKHGFPIKKQKNKNRFSQRKNRSSEKSEKLPTKKEKLIKGLIDLVF